jgi:hypothetical protein
MSTVVKPSSLDPILRDSIEDLSDEGVYELFGLIRNRIIDIAARKAGEAVKALVDDVQKRANDA